MTTMAKYVALSLVCLFTLVTIVTGDVCGKLNKAMSEIQFCVSSHSHEASSAQHLKATGRDKPAITSSEERLLQLQIMTGLPRGAIESCLDKMSCDQPKVTCPNPDTYSRPDGVCNNLRHPTWGSDGQALLRDLPAEYHDGVQSVRRSVTSAELPNPRQVSNKVFRQLNDSQSPEYTLWVMAFGQKLAHDFIKTNLTTDVNGHSIDCCDENISATCPTQCLPVDVSNDEYFKSVNVTCLNFVRSTPVPCNVCDVDEPCVRNQVNIISAYIDGGSVYGHNLADLETLRDGAFLRSRRHQDDPHAYLSANPDLEACRDGTTEQPCYSAGDRRVNEAPNLQAILTLMMREHNRVAAKLQEMNGGVWTDEVVFQEARKIVIAEIQKITFQDYMPVVIGKELVDLYDLDLPAGYDAVYDPDVDAGISNQVGTAAFRFGHTLIPNNLGYSRNSDNTMLREFPLDKNFFRVAQSYEAPYHCGIMRYLQSTGAQEPDRSLTDAVRNRLFLDLATNASLDLAALNVMRGRDHGLPSYNKWKAWCGQESFPADHTKENAQLIREVYESDADIDLFAGGLSEIRLPGGVVGPLFGCIIGRQFQRLKVGDRFFFTNPPDDTTTIGRFTEHQVNEIQKQTLARIVCENTDTQIVQKNIFLRSFVPGNQEVPCSSYEELPDIDFTMWKI